MKHWTIAVAIVFALQGCAIQTHYIQTGSQKLEKVKTSEVKLYVKAPEGQAYDVIGSVAVDQLGNAKDAQTAIKQEAAMIGANAVIDVKLTKLASFAQRTGISGVAVRFK